MKLGIMQPYFFPYFGHFELIARTDRWVVFDVVQYNQKSWMARNRILHPTRGWQYISVPVVKAPHGTAISETRIVDRTAALTRILGQLDHYHKHAPHFRRVVDLVRAVFDIKSDRLVDLNVSALKTVCAALGLPFQHSICSEMNLELGEVEHAGQWALRIASQLGATEYVNPPGGRDIFDRTEWDAKAIRLTIFDSPPFRYDCAPYAFVENLSIIDVLMWNDVSTVAAELRTRASRT